MSANTFTNVQGPQTNPNYLEWYATNAAAELANLQDIKQQHLQDQITQEANAFDVERSEFGKEVDEFKGYLLGITSPAYASTLSEVSIRDSLYPDEAYKLAKDNSNSWLLAAAAIAFAWWYLK